VPERWRFRVVLAPCRGASVALPIALPLQLVDLALQCSLSGIPFALFAFALVAAACSACVGLGSLDDVYAVRIGVCVYELRCVRLGMYA
jgi:hypothetical protein